MRFVKHFGWLAALAFGCRSVLGFALLGPPTIPTPTADAYQVPTIGYNIPGRDIGTPRNIGEEYRWNTPFIYYAFDATFLDYFGSNGVYAIEQAIAIVNALTNTPFSSLDLSLFPEESQRINFTAQQLHLLDLKSQALHFIIEELGLTEPDRYTWTLRDRFGPTCPTAMTYFVIKRNFDPVTFEPSSYVNGGLWSYWIYEDCSDSPVPSATTVNFPVDPLAQEFSAVMSVSGSVLTFGGIVRDGAYVTGLSRDDVGGLRYIYRTNNMNTEAISSDSVIQQTNLLSTLLFTSNLVGFAQAALTNNAAGLQALYPGLVILSTTNSFSNVWITNVTPYFTNYPFDPVGTPPHLAFQTNRTRAVLTLFHHTFANLFTFSNSAGTWKIMPLPALPPATRRQWITLQTATIGVQNNPWGPVGSTLIVTNFTSQTSLSNAVVGEFFIMPTNLCNIGLIGTQLTNVITSSNVLATATNVLTGTNVVGTQLGFTLTAFDYFTNHVFLYYPVTCTSNSVVLRQGMNKITFLRANYDSLLGRFFQPITNIYHLTGVVGSLPQDQVLRRLVIAPDFLFNSQDLNASILGRTGAGASAFNPDNRLPGLAGPGNIEPGKSITFNRVGPLLVNFYDPFFVNTNLTERTAVTNFVWGSFDGTTNYPIVYPQGTSIMDLENQVIFQVITTSLPDGRIGVPYAAPALEAAGGTPPYTWGVVPGGTPLPPGLTISADGLISGTPTARGTFNFSVTASDSAARTTGRGLSITVTP